MNLHAFLLSDLQSTKQGQSEGVSSPVDQSSIPVQKGQSWFGNEARSGNRDSFRMPEIILITEHHKLPRSAGYCSFKIAGDPQRWRVAKDGQSNLDSGPRTVKLREHRLDDLNRRVARVIVTEHNLERQERLTKNASDLFAHEVSTIAGAERNRN
jgi:hypothetical protein